MTRAEHLQWAKDRALEYLPAEPAQGMTSMMSDLSKHPELKDHPGLSGWPQWFYGAHNDPAAVRQWIEGFN